MSYDCNGFLEQLYEYHYENLLGVEPSDKDQINNFKKALEKKRNKYSNLAILFQAINYIIPIIVASAIIKYFLTENGYALFLSVINIVLLIIVFLYNAKVLKKYRLYNGFSELTKEIRTYKISNGNKISDDSILSFLNKYNQIMENRAITEKI